MDIDVRYITDKDWKPQVTSASIPGAPKDLKIDIYGEGTEETNDGYYINTVDEDGKKQFSPLRIHNTNGLGYDAGDYIRRLQEE
ncbi:MAG: hypothetical protein HFE76_10305 [Firmicutes bacterium]|nr:hypothetical protein [Bacillota bacterium]